MGESPSNCSFHLRQLAKYGFVEEAEGGTGRQRPWQLVHIGMRFTDVQEDTETALAAARAGDVLHERWLARARRAAGVAPAPAEGVARGHRQRPVRRST